MKNQQNTVQQHELPAILSFFIPGVGQAIKGHFKKMLLIWSTYIIMVFLLPLSIIIILPVWIWNIYDAYNSNADATWHELNSHYVKQVNTTSLTQQEKPAQSKVAMILLSFFLGGLGVHRLLMGYSNWWLMLITLGGFGIWTLIDFIRIITGSMKMKDGRELV